MRKEYTKSLLAGTAAAVIALSSSSASAQVGLPYVPPELYPDHRWLQGDSIRFCLWHVSPTLEVDRLIAEEIANALLLDVEFYEHTSTMPIDSFEFWELVYIQLTQHCDAVMGFTMSIEIEAEWLTPTRSYYDAPFVVATTDPDYDSLGDVPYDEAVGAVLFSDGDNRLIEYMRLQPRDQRWTRYPFSRGEQGLRFLLDDRVAAVIFWAPTLHELTDGDPESLGIRMISMDPLPETTTPIGMMLRERNVFLRNELDQAITALIQDGTIENILESANLPGTAGRD